MHPFTATLTPALANANLFSHLCLLSQLLGHSAGPVRAGRRGGPDVQALSRLLSRLLQSEASHAALADNALAPSHIAQYAGLGFVLLQLRWEYPAQRDGLQQLLMLAIARALCQLSVCRRIS